jgi:shikimate dehydrogenase
MLGLSGANITTPFKEDVIPFVDKLSPEAKMIGAVNTIISDNGKLTGFNSDADGITGSLREAGIEPSGRRCLVLGAGGAGKAAVSGLVRGGADVTLANRNRDKARDFAGVSGCRVVSLDEIQGIIKKIDILVLALPPGVYPFDMKSIHPGMTVIDANYRPPGNDINTVNLPGRVIKGDRWLLHQAVEAYRLFTGKMADTRVMEEGMKKNIDPALTVIKPVKEDTISFTNHFTADMVIDGRKMDDLQINAIIDEEKDRAFGR